MLTACYAPIRTQKRLDEEVHRMEVTQRVRRHLSHHNHFHGHLDTLSIDYRDETLVLQGKVPTFYLKQVLQEILRNVPGVRNISNRVDVVSPRGISSVNNSNSENRRCHE